MPIAITDPDDPRIEAYRAVRERDLIGRAERFIVEGEVVLRVFLTRSPFAAESLLIAEQRVPGLAPLLAGVPGPVPVYTAGRSVMDAIVGFPIHRGILAVGRRPPPIPLETLLGTLPDEALVVALIGLSNHDNVGGIFRNAAAFGAQAVLMDPSTCDPLYRKAVRVSVGGSLVVPFARAASGDHLVGALDRAGFDIVALTPSGSEPLRGMRRERRTALLLGAEGPGLPPELINRLRSVAIPMRGGFDSLNVATTSGIALYELSSGRPGRSPADPAEL